MSEKDKVTSDSGIELSRKSESGSGSFAGIGKSSFTKDLNDSGNASRRGTYDDEYDDDYIGTDIISLEAFLQNLPIGDDIGDEEDEDEEKGEECFEEIDEECEVEGDYETDEEEAVVSKSHEEIVATENTPSRELLKEQREEKKKSFKAKKKALINEYLHDARRFEILRAKNVLLGLKISTHIDQKRSIIEKYVKQELEEQRRQKEAEELKRQHFMENCASLNHDSKKKKKKKGVVTKKKVPSFSIGLDKPDNVQTSSSDPDQMKDMLKRKFNDDTDKTMTFETPEVSLSTLGNAQSKPVQDKATATSNNQKTCKRRKYLKQRIGRKLRRFSFHRSLFLLEDVITQPKIHKKSKSRMDLMNINIDKLRSRSSRLLREGKSSKVPLTVPEDVPGNENNALSTRIQSKTDSKKSTKNVAKSAQALAKSKSRMALDHHKQEQKIRLYADSTNYKDLHHFKFEFADPRLTTKQASVKLREELLKLLHHRNVPTTQLRWPLEVKGMEFEGKNPYGRVSLNYTRLSHHEKELPHTAYRILLTNMAYLRTKEQRMNKEHRKSMMQLENECTNLKYGLNKIFNEIVEGIRIFTSLCGLNAYEKKKEIQASEDFIHELQKFFDEFLTETLINLYKCIHSCEFALRKLWISEGKGEGAELHEFKDIMRCREKLKAEHRSIENTIWKYQHHTKTVLKSVQKSGRKLQETKESTSQKNSELDHMKKAVNIMIDGLYFCQGSVQSALATEAQLKTETGILNSPVVTEDYYKLLSKMEATNIKRIDLQRQYNSRIREIEKIVQPSSRYVRYKLRS